jgi:hypothetical protein
MADAKPNTPAPSSRVLIEVDIASGQSLSETVDLTGLIPVAIAMPATWTAGSLTIQAATADGGTYNNVYNSDDTEFEISAAASRFIVLSPLTSVAFQFIKIRSGTSGTPVNQGGARTLTIIARPFQ